MGTPSRVLKRIIIETLHSAAPEPVSPDRLYRAVESQVEFDDDDLTPPRLHGGRVKEPSWRRNVRNVLQALKDSGELVNVARNAWRLPSPDPQRRLDESQAWQLVRAAAENELGQPSEFESTMRGQRYRVASVTDRQIVIDRLDSPARETLSSTEVERAVRYLNSAGGRLGRRAAHYTVAKEVALVYLHPQLEWSEDREWIEVVGSGPRQVPRTIYEEFGQAPDDNPAELSRFARKVRAGQPKFRRNLLRAYEERCAITGWGPAAVLEAAHVLLHANTGNNHVNNGLLLRADLHLLFDDGMIRIHPHTYAVVLDPTLHDSEYRNLQGARLRPRIDGGYPNREYLKVRWEAGL